MADDSTGVDPDRVEPKGSDDKFDVLRIGPAAAQELYQDRPTLVLDLAHDEHARRAALAYAESCQWTLPELANDIRYLVADVIVNPRMIVDPRSPHAHTEHGCICGGHD